MNFVLSLLQLVHKFQEDRAVLCGGETLDVLKQDRAGLEMVNDRKEAAPQIGAIVSGSAASFSYKTANLGNAGKGEGLTGRPPCDQVDTINSPLAQLFDELVWIPKVSSPSEALDICGVTLDCRRF